MLVLELGKESPVVFREQSQIVDSVEQVGNTFHADSEGEAAVYVRVNAAVFQDRRIYHAAAQDFHPPGVFAKSTSFPCADGACDIHFGRRLGEREIGGTEPDFSVVPEHFPGKIQQCVMQVGKGDILIYVQSFYLMEKAVSAS